MANSSEMWPLIPFAECKATWATLHMMTQIIGKVRLALAPWTNHSWHVTLYVTARGLTTSPIPYDGRVFEIRFDFIDHTVRILTVEGDVADIALKPQSIAQFYGSLMQQLEQLKLPVQITTIPNEVVDAIPFEKDQIHRDYNPEQANRLWRALVQADRVFKQFRARFCGKCSPVHFFWGSFDLAVTRFSGRPAPSHPGGIPHLPDAVTREAYSQEVSSLGFWPGNDLMPQAVFYSYAYPAPEGFPSYPIQPAGASFNPQLKEFVLPYDAVRMSSSPDDMLLAFAQSAYDAASTLANWNRDALVEHKPDLPSARHRR